VRERGKFEAGEKFFGDGRPADDIAAFKDERRVTLFRQVERRDEGVVTAAENYNIAFGGHA
jgi:hypothetical protein